MLSKVYLETKLEIYSSARVCDNKDPQRTDKTRQDRKDGKDRQDIIQKQRIIEQIG